MLQQFAIERTREKLKINNGLDHSPDAVLGYIVQNNLKYNEVGSNRSSPLPSATDL